MNRRSFLQATAAALSAEKNLHFDRFEGGHQWSGRVAFPLFDKILS